MPGPFANKGATKSARLLSSAASDNATKASDGPCSLRHVIGENTNAARRFLKIYALSSALAAPASTDTPVLTFSLPASSAFALDLGDGYDFSFGMGYRITTGSADNDAGTVSAGDIVGLNFLLA